MKHFLARNFILICFLIMPAVAMANEHVATITMAEGLVHKVTDAEKIELKTGDTLNLYDRIETSENGTIVLTFIDETKLSLGNKTDLVIDEYVYDPDNTKDNKAVFTLERGPFHYISGLIAKKEKPDVTLNLDFGSIGIRGTKIWRDMNYDENGQQQCRIYIEDGKARVSNDLGFTTLNDGDGTRIVGLNKAPTEAKQWSQENIDEIKAQSPAL